MPDVPLLGQEAANARATQASPEPDPENTAPKVVEAFTAILLIQTAAGETILTTDINALVTVTHPASRDEAYGMLATAMKDMTVAETAAHTAETTIEMIAEKQRQAIVAAQNAAIQQQVNQGRT